MTTYGDSDSLTELERQAEATRADLVHTVDTLHSRISPQAIKSDIKDYARDTGQQFLHNLETRARENPLQTAAIAAGLAYPIWRMVSHIPAPILLVGAGLAMTRRNPGMHSGAWQGDTADAIKGKAADVMEGATSRLQSLGAQASEATASAKDSLSSAYQGGIDKAAEVTQQASDSLARGKDSVVELIEKHPFIVGGVTFLIGGLVASSLPVSRTENRVLGETSDHLKDRVQDIAAEGLDSATMAAEQVYHDTVSDVKERGFTAEAARNAVRNVADKVDSVVKSAAEEADPKRPKSNVRRMPR